MKILVATDGSKPALHAVKYATRFASKLAQAPSITVLSVHDDTALRHARSLVGKEAVADYLREWSEKDMRPARKALDASGIKHDFEIRTGHVAQELVDCAKSGKFDLVVLGAKGRGAVADLLLGSVAQRVLATAPCPVLLVR